MTSRIEQSEVEIDLAADAVSRAAVDELARNDDARKLEAAVRLRNTLDALVTEFVVSAREGGATWAEVGEVLGVSTQAAHQKYRYVTSSAD